MDLQIRALPFIAAVALGCATSGPSPSPAPPEVAETPQPGDPVVKLIDPGAEPRAPLRFRLAAGHRSTMLLEMAMDMDMAMGGSKMPAVKVPPVHMTMLMEVTKVDPDGVTHNTARVTAVDVLAREGDKPELVARLKKEMATLVGMNMEMKITSRGLTRDAKVTVPDGAPPQVHTMVESMRNAIQQTAAIFPTEPVGTGARWRVESAVDNGTLKFQQATVVTLNRREPNQVWLSFAIEQKADPQPMTPRGLPPGTTASLESHSGKGQGQWESALDSRTPRVQMSVRTQTASTVVMNQNRANLNVDLKMDVKVAPVEPTP